MRLYDTLTRSHVELPPPPGPIGAYVCGSTVYQRVHVGNSRPFVLAMWLRGWLREKGYDVTLVHNITDVDDKVYVEAAKREVASRDLAEWATGWFVEDTDGAGGERDGHGLVVAGAHRYQIQLSLTAER